MIISTTRRSNFIRSSFQRRAVNPRHVAVARRTSVTVVPKDADFTLIMFDDRAAIDRAILPADPVAYLE
jgi:hypothetical protein